LVFFLQLRIADEFKDHQEDSRYRPYRPVPRGLVTLRELGTIAIAGALVQLALALYLKPELALLLILVWIYMFFMISEFFVRPWLKAHPFTYMWSHMLIMPLVTLYITACDWLVVGTTPTPGLLWFLAVSFFTGIVLEIARKIRAPHDEERGVETYSSLWGPRNAVIAWLGAFVLAVAVGLLAADRIGLAGPFVAMLSVMTVVIVLSGWHFIREPLSKRAKLIENVSGFGTLLIYLSLGFMPLLLGL
jgi:4-hydroxybenzoate polyprenyltransferase